MRKNMYSYGHAQDLALQLEKVLSDVGISIKNGGALEAVLLNVIKMYEEYLHLELRANGEEDIRQYHRDFLGATDLACKIIYASDHKDFKNTAKHLEILNDMHPVQNSFTSVINQSNNKIFELYVACLCMMEGGLDVQLDDPSSSNGTNPDILATFQGVRWGFACKALHSPKGMTIYENLKKAVEQIQASPAKIGIPILNAKNIILHDESWQMLDDPEVPGEVMYTAHLDTSHAIQLLNDVANSINESVAEAAREELFDLFADNNKCVQGYLLYLPTTTTTWIDNQPVTTRLNLFHLIEVGLVIPQAKELFILLNEQLQRM